MNDYIDNTVNDEFSIYKAPVLIIDRFPSEFKKSWLKALDIRFLLILVTTFIVLTSLVSYLSSRQINQIDSQIDNKLYEKYAHLLIPDNPSNDFLVFKEKSKETYLLGIPEKLEETLIETNNQKEFVSSSSATKKGSTKSLTSFGNNAVSNYSETGDSPFVENVSSAGILKFITTDSRLAENTADDILGIEQESSSAPFSNLKSLQVARKLSDLGLNKDQENHYKIRGTKIEKVAFKDVINSLSPKDKVEFNVITKNVEFEDIPTTNLVKNINKKGKGATRSPEEITRIIMSHNRAIQDCYKQTLKRYPKIKGKIVIRFSITPDGTVSHVNIINSTINDDKIKQCILGRVKRWNDFGYCDPEMGDLYYRQTYVFGF